MERDSGAQSEHQNMAGTNAALAGANCTYPAQSAHKGLSRGKENTGAAATAPGVKIAKKPLGSCRKNTTSKGKSAISLYGKDGHKRIAKAVGFALTIGSTAAWHALTILLIARLTEAERAGLAYSAMRSLDEDNAYAVASLAIFGVSKGEVAQ